MANMYGVGMPPQIRLVQHLFVRVSFILLFFWYINSWRWEDLNIRYLRWKFQEMPTSDANEMCYKLLLLR